MRGTLPWMMPARVWPFTFREAREYPGAAVQSSSRSLALAAVLVVALAALLYGPAVGPPELKNEEGRRAIVAREMLASGDFLLPTVWGRPYVTKPPLLFWCIAGFGALAGEVTPPIARLPSLFATCATALAVLLVGARHGGTRQGALAAVLFLTTLGVMAKGTIAEVEPLFAFLAFVAVYLGWRASAGSLRAAVLGGLALGGALATKGPPALVFQLGALGGLAASGGSLRPLVGGRAPLVWAIGLALPLAWLGALFASHDPSGLLSTWTDELRGERGGGVAGYLAERVQLAVGAVPAFLPASAVLVAAYALRRERERLLASEVHRLATAALVAATAFFLVSPRAASRYLYPLVPWACLVAGACIARAWDADADARRARGLARGLARGCAVLALAVVAAGIVHALVRPLAQVELDTLGVALLAALAGAGVLGLVFARGRPTTALLAGLAAIALGRLVHVTQVVPDFAQRHGLAQQAALLEAALPPGEPVYVSVWSEFNTLAYVRRELVFVERPRELPAGALVIADGEREPGPRWERLLAVPAETDDRAPLLAVLRARD